VVETALCVDFKSLFLHSNSSWRRRWRTSTAEGTNFVATRHIVHSHKLAYTV